MNLEKKCKDGLEESPSIKERILAPIGRFLRSPYRTAKEFVIDAFSSPDTDSADRLVADIRDMDPVVNMSAYLAELQAAADGFKDAKQKALLAPWEMFLSLFGAKEAYEVGSMQSDTVGYVAAAVTAAATLGGIPAIRAAGLSDAREQLQGLLGEFQQHLVPFQDYLSNKDDVNGEAELHSEELAAISGKLKHLQESIGPALQERYAEALEQAGADAERLDAKLDNLITQTNDKYGSIRAQLKSAGATAEDAYSLAKAVQGALADLSLQVRLGQPTGQEIPGQTGEIVQDYTIPIAQLTANLRGVMQRLQEAGAEARKRLDKEVKAIYDAKFQPVLEFVGTPFAPMFTPSYLVKESREDSFDTNPGILWPGEDSESGEERAYQLVADPSIKGYCLFRGFAGEDSQDSIMSVFLALSIDNRYTSPEESRLVLHLGKGKSEYGISTSALFQVLRGLQKGYDHVIVHGVGDGDFTRNSITAQDSVYSQFGDLVTEDIGPGRLTVIANEGICRWELDGKPVRYDGHENEDPISTMGRDPTVEDAIRYHRERTVSDNEAQIATLQREIDASYTLQEQMTLALAGAAKLDMNDREAALALARLYDKLPEEVRQLAEPRVF